MSYRTVILIAVAAILGIVCVSTDAEAYRVRRGVGVAVGVGVGLGAAAVVGRRYGPGVCYGPGRRFWRGQWYDYGVGSCWASAPVGYVWICR
jgi:hypothetical protein